MADIKRYELFGWDYDHYNPREPRAEAWYLRHLESGLGPVLELACGCGRLLEAFARAGRTVSSYRLTAHGTMRTFGSVLPGGGASNGNDSARRMQSPTSWLRSWIARGRFSNATCRRATNVLTW